MQTRRSVIAAVLGLTTLSALGTTGCGGGGSTALGDPSSQGRGDAVVTRQTSGIEGMVLAGPLHPVQAVPEDASATQVDPSTPGSFDTAGGQSVAAQAAPSDADGQKDLRPLPGATISVRVQPAVRTDAEQPELARAVTDAEGKFRVALAPGTYEVRIIPPSVAANYQPYIPVDGTIGVAVKADTFSTVGTVCVSGGAALGAP